MWFIYRRDFVESKTKKHDQNPIYLRTVNMSYASSIDIKNNDVLFYCLIKNVVEIIIRARINFRVNFIELITYKNFS